jgi:predicted transcriptional regulator of viral defense system
VDYTKKLLKLIKKNGGMITSSQVTNADIPRTYLSSMEQKGNLVRIKRGFYVLPDVFEDEMYVLACSYPKGVFSHGTALYIHKMTDRTPIVYEMSFPQKYHFRKNEDNLKIRYLTKDVFEFGIENKKSPCQNNIRVYDIEHTLCDILKANYDVQIINDAMKRYIKSDKCNVNKLLEYAEKIKVKNKISNYLKVLL